MSKQLTIVLATENKNKLREIRQVCDMMALNAEVKSGSDFCISDYPPEDADSFSGNALIKARHIFDNLQEKENTVVIADDSGLCVDALNGRPGVYSARYAGENATDEMRIEKLIGELTGVETSRRTAAFVCCMIAIMPDGKVLEAVGKMEGYITEEPSGNNGFGYDPVLYIPEKEKTVAELSADEKNKISHRSKALQEILSLISKELGDKA